MAFLYIFCLSLLALAGLWLVFLGLGFPLRPLSLMGSKRIMFVGFSLVCIALEIGFLWLVVTKAPSPQAAIGQIVRTAMASAAVHIMRSKTPLPQKIDEQITYVDMLSEKDTVINDYTINTNGSDELFRNIMEQLHGGLTKQACERSDYHELFKNGLSVQLRFNEIGTPYVDKILFTPQQCGF